MNLVPPLNDDAESQNGEKPTPATVANLRSAKKEVAAAKKAAGTPAKKVAKKVAKAPAKKAAAKKAPAKKGTQNNIKWVIKGEKNDKGEAEGTGTLDDKTYEIIKQDDDLWRCTVKVSEGEPELLGENLKTSKAAWQKCVDHAKGKKTDVPADKTDVPAEVS